MIRVLIERHIADELSEHYERLSRETLQKAMHWPGFISGEALHNTADPNHRLILAPIDPRMTGCSGMPRKNAGI